MTHNVCRKSRDKSSQTTNDWNNCLISYFPVIVADDRNKTLAGLCSWPHFLAKFSTFQHAIARDCFIFLFSGARQSLRFWSAFGACQRLSLTNWNQGFGTGTRNSAQRPTPTPDAGKMRTRTEKIIGNRCRVWWAPINEVGSKTLPGYMRHRLGSDYVKSIEILGYFWLLFYIREQFTKFDEKVL